LNGAPVAGVSLDLRFYNGAAWSTRATTWTNAQGLYIFTGIPSLSPGQVYYVRFVNPAQAGDGRLSFWATRDLTIYAAGSEVNLGNFDLADIQFVAPPPGAYLPMPVAFQWVRRPATTSDSYDFNLFDPSNPNLFFYTDPPLGYVSSYLLSTMPGGFTTNRYYGWYVGVFSPDGGYGLSFYYSPVAFSTTGFSLNANRASALVPLPDPSLLKETPRPAE
jgi:hypothetical protein